MEICDHYNISIESTASTEEIRQTLAEFVRGQAGKAEKKETEESEESPGSTPSETPVDAMTPNR